MIPALPQTNPIVYASGAYTLRHTHVVSKGRSMATCWSVKPDHVKIINVTHRQYLDRSTNMYNVIK